MHTGSIYLQCRTTDSRASVCCFQQRPSLGETRLLDVSVEASCLDMRLTREWWSQKTRGQCEEDPLLRAMDAHHQETFAEDADSPMSTRNALGTFGRLHCKETSSCRTSCFFEKFGGKAASASERNRSFQELVSRQKQVPLSALKHRRNDYRGLIAVEHIKTRH